MITYELARQLKDAGFPQKGLHWNPNIKFIDQKPETPTLSELIEACEYDFNSLSAIYSNTAKQERIIVGWIAYGVGRGWNADTMFDSPQEAVANLYIKLNKK